MEMLENENLVWDGRPSWRAMMSFYLKWLVVAIVVLVVAVAIDNLRDGSGLTGWGVLVAAVLLAIAVAVGWLRRISTHYTITDRRIVISRGIISRNEQRAHIDRVQNISLEQTFFDRLFQVGTLDFDTAGTDDSDFRFVGIADPARLRDRIDREYVARTREMQGDRR